MNLNMHEKPINSIYFEGGIGNYSGNPERIGAGPDVEGRRTLYLSATFHGDHEQYWVIEAINGQEVRRHNVRSIATIIWELPTTVSAPKGTP